MEKLNHAELLTLYSDVPFQKIDKAQPMLSQQDKLLYYYLAKNYYTGEGNIIDGCAFVGGTTICFSTGLMGNKNYTKDKKLIVYDLFRDSLDGFNSKYLQQRFSQEDFILGQDYIDFEKIFLKNIKFYEKYINIVVNKGNFLDYKTYNYQNPIEILSIDIAKNKDLMLHACHTFFPRLIAGKSLVILQDWITVPLPFIHIAMNLLNEYFDGYYECPNGSSKVFKCKKEITPEVINNVIGNKIEDYYNIISNAKYIAMAIDDAVSIHNKATLEGALAMFYLHMGKKETAKQHFFDTIVKYDLSSQFITNFPFSEIYQIFKDDIKYYPPVYSKFQNTEPLCNSVNTSFDNYNKLNDPTDYLQKKLVWRESNINGDMQKAWSFMKQGKQIEALIEAENVPSSDPFFYDAKVLCGQIKISMKDYDTAEQYLNEAINLKPNSLSAYMRRAWLRWYQKQPELSLNDVKKAEAIIELIDEPLSVEDWIIEGIEKVKQALFEENINIEEKKNLEEKYRFDDPQSLREMNDVLKKTYFKYVDEESLNQPEFKQDIEDHLFKRYHNTLFNYVPWIMACFDLTNKNIVEIGCGTGSSTAAFARFANHIYAYEIASESLLAARERMRIMGVDNVDIREVTPENILSKIKADNPLGVDVIILFAVLEHMKINERLETLKDCWKLLKPNGILIIAETPNRLTYYDAHTSWLPFFHMLPEDLGIEYYQKSPRNNFKQAISRSIKDAGIDGGKETLIRWGNGVSFHEFEIAIESDLNDLIINDGNAKEMRAIYPVSPTEELLKSYFEQAQVNQPLTFTHEILNFILQKKMS